jgi:hypothetical protein
MNRLSINAPRTHPHPPTPASALHLVLRLVVYPLSGICLRPPRHHPFRTHSRRRIRDIPPLLAHPPPRFMAPYTRYGRRIHRSDIQHVLRRPSRVTDTLRRIRGAHRRICRVLWRKHLFDDARTHLACHLRTREYPPRRQCGESCVV